MTVRPYDFWLALLFDEALRMRFTNDVVQTLSESGLSEEAQAVFAKVDLHGLALDAKGRGQYLMSALCRSFPFTVACLGTAEGADHGMRLFLKEIPSFHNLSERTLAFGSHLGELIGENLWNAKPVLVELVRAIHEFEMAVAKNTARCREAVNAGQPTPRVEKVSNSAIKRQNLVLPPFMLVSQLPVSFGVLAQALFNPAPETIWERVQTKHSLDQARLESVASGATLPVTVVARAQVLGIQGQRGGSGAVAPLIHVSHLKMELSGRKASLFHAIKGDQKLADYPTELQKPLRQFIDAGFVALK